MFCQLNIDWKVREKYLDNDLASLAGRNEVLVKVIGQSWIVFSVAAKSRKI